MSRAKRFLKTFGEDLGVTPKDIVQKLQHLVKAGDAVKTPHVGASIGPTGTKTAQFQVDKSGRGAPHPMSGEMRIDPKTGKCKITVAEFDDKGDETEIDVVKRYTSVDDFVADCEKFKDMMLKAKSLKDVNLKSL